MKKAIKYFVLPITIIILVMVLLPHILYRIPGEKSKIFQKEIRYQMIDFGQNGGLRWAFEESRGNKRLFLIPEDSAGNWIYVSHDDFKKCWPLPISQMMHDTVTFIAIFQTTHLLFVNEYAPAKILDVKRIKKSPVIRK